MSTEKGWIGVDLDGTLAHYDGCKGVEHIGEPIPAMVLRVRTWLAAGQEVRIMTARVFGELDPSVFPHNTRRIKAWCFKHIGLELDVTCVKDYQMLELWDDRAVRVVMNTGERCCA